MLFRESFHSETMHMVSVALSELLEYISDVYSKQVHCGFLHAFSHWNVGSYAVHIKGPGARFSKVPVTYRAR